MAIGPDSLGVGVVGLRAKRARLKYDPGYIWKHGWAIDA